MTASPYRPHAEELAAGIHWAHRENFIRTYIRLREVDAIVSGRTPEPPNALTLASNALTGTATVQRVREGLARRDRACNEPLSGA